MRRITRWFGKAQNPRLSGISIAAGVVLRGERKLTYGTGCFIDVGAYMNCAGGAWNDYAGFITMGDNCEIGPYSVLLGAGGITLGNNVHLGAHVAISANQLRRDGGEATSPYTMSFAPVVVEDDVLIGPNVSIAPGIRIGRNSTIGAGSAVVSDIPPNSVAVGCPARVMMKTPKREELLRNPST